MTTTDFEIDEPKANPIDLIENLVSTQGWPYERNADDELSICVAGKWCDHHLSFTFRADIEALHIASTFDFKTPGDRRHDLYALLGMINERLWLGHFDLSSDDGTVVYRHGMLLQGGAGLTTQQCDGLLHVAVECAEKYYPAFQFLIWGGKSARDAMDSSMFDCAGEA